MKIRIITGVIGGALFLSLLWLGGAAFSLVVALLAIIGWNEYAKMSRIAQYRIPTFLGYLFIVLFFLSSLSPTNVFITQYQQQLVLLIAVVLLLFMVGSKNRFTVEKAGAMFIGLVYIGFGFALFLETRLEYGFAFILFILSVIWSTDSGAYFIGKRFGRRKLWPAISPNKTVEGSSGAIIVALLVSFLFQTVYPLFDSVWEVVLFTVVISVVGQLGDLVESAIKRYYNVKDSGTLLPGHGGVLDRFDSLLFVFPVLYLLQLI